jgi:hypothetical protein
MLYDEGWAVWLSARMLPEIAMRQLFMSNLHAAIGMTDPGGGYLPWCRKNLRKIATEAQKVLKSRDKNNLGRLFQCRRLGGDSTPIRTGYYLGFKIVEQLSARYTARQLMLLKPTARSVSTWLNETIATI